MSLIIEIMKILLCVQDYIKISSVYVRSDFKKNLWTKLPIIALSLSKINYFHVSEFMTTFNYVS